MRTLGIDIGGTYIKYMLKENGKVKEIHETLSHASEGAKELLKTVYRICDARKFDLLGVSTAGMVGPNGEIAYANQSIPNYTGVKLKQLLEKRYKCKVAVLNDIYAASLSELSPKFKDYYFISIGTGISGAFVQDGKILMGHKLFAGQITYLPSRDGTDIVDNKASIRGLKSFTKISPLDLFDEIDKGNKEAKKAMKQWCGELVHLITMVVAFFNPKYIVLSGGITRQGKKLIKLIEQEYHLIPKPYQNSFKLLIAKEQQLAGAVGAINNVEKMYK